MVSVSEIFAALKTQKSTKDCAWATKRLGDHTSGRFPMQCVIRTAGVASSHAVSDWVISF